MGHAIVGPEQQQAVAGRGHRGACHQRIGGLVLRGVAAARERKTGDAGPGKGAGGGRGRVRMEGWQAERWGEMRWKE